MADKAYGYMDWAAIEGLVYSEEAHPRRILAPRKVSEGILYQCYLPGAAKVRLHDLTSGQTHHMAMEDETGYFACVVPGKAPAPHTFIADGSETGDPYAFGSFLTPETESRFTAGIDNRLGRTLGAHPAEAEGQRGVRFALWAPGALRVSVVGPFCHWDGRQYPMELHEESGIFELFIPGLAAGAVYRYELKLKNGLVYTRPDPCGSEQMIGEDPCSVVADPAYEWSDQRYMAERTGAAASASRPVAILECSLADWKKRSDRPEEETYRTLADRIAAYAKDLGYTHIELKPVMEYADDSSEGYHTTGYFAPTRRFGHPADFKYFVDVMHRAGIGVILDWTPAQFSPDTRYLASFDGTCLYEHLDPRQGVHPIWGTKLFNYGRPEVRSFLMSSADLWMREYHADGLRLDGCSTMLRLDYARGDRWVANLYGSWENLDGIEFLRRLSDRFHRSFPGGLLIMAEDVDWPDVTAPTEDNGLGFDYKWNLHFTQDMLHYLSLDEEGRRNEYASLTNGMLHHYLDRFILSLSRGIGPFDRDQFLASVNGDETSKAALVRAAYAFLIMHPGKKLLTDGEGWSDAFLRELLAMYRTQPALSVHDYDESGFEWINTMDSGHITISFVRRGNAPGNLLLAVCNFSDESYEAYRVGVPLSGRYREILNSDSRAFGGSGMTNPRIRATRKISCDERESSLTFRIAARSVAVFQYQEKK